MSQPLFTMKDMSNLVRIDPLHHAWIDIHHLEHRGVSWVPSPSLTPDDLCHWPGRLIRHDDVGRLTHHHELTWTNTEEQWWGVTLSRVGSCWALASAHWAKTVDPYYEAIPGKVVQCADKRILITTIWTNNVNTLDESSIAPGSTNRCGSASQSVGGCWAWETTSLLLRVYYWSGSDFVRRGLRWADYKRVCTVFLAYRRWRDIKGCTSERYSNQIKRGSNLCHENRWLQWRVSIE